ncbi:hypothetical protein IMSAGC019_00260 [Lachnospiraceae bacterium]|nr:hypothetical protein IMSAGC019_00260 [Lachnospiraceae bacterium]
MKMRKVLRLLIEKYFIIPTIKLSLAKELFMDNTKMLNYEIVFIGDIGDYRMIRSILKRRMYFIDGVKIINELEKSKAVSRYFYIITGNNYMHLINYFDKKGVKNWAFIPLYDVKFSI